MFDVLKRSRKKIYKIAVVSCFSLFLGLLAGCGKEKQDHTEYTDNYDTIVFTYGDNQVTLAEVYIYINSVKERYELMYGADVWSVSFPEDNDGTVSMVDLTKERVVSEIVRVKTLSAHARDYGIALTEEEETIIKDEAHEFYKGMTDADIEKMEMTEECIYMVLYENKIASIVQQKLLESDSIEVSDEEARMTTFYDLYFPCFKKSYDGSVVEVSDEEKEAMYDKALEACSAIGTSTLDDKAEENTMENLAITYDLTEAKEQTMSPEEILNTYGSTIYNLLYSMKNGEYTTVIESEYGYHVFEMRALTDRKATNGKKEQMTEALIEECLSETMSIWQKEIDENFSYPASINMDVYDKISGF